MRSLVVLVLCAVTVGLSSPAHAIQAVLASGAGAGAGVSRIDSYILVVGEAATMSGSIRDRESVTALRRRFGGVFLYVRRGGERLVINDAALLAPLLPLHDKQARLGQKQGELGDRQGELGRQQALLAGAMSKATHRLERRARSGVSDGSLEREVSELAARQSHLGEEQARLGEEQAHYGAQQSLLATQLRQRMDGIVDEAVRRGLVTRL